MQSLSKKQKTIIRPTSRVTDLPECIATGFTIEETEREIREAIRLHMDRLIEDGLSIPQPASIVEYLEIVA